MRSLQLGGAETEKRRTLTKLNQIIAIESGVKSKALRDETDLYRVLGKPALLTGISRTYRKKDDDGDDFPSESTPVQVTVDDVLNKLSSSLVRLFDVTLTKEAANAQAKADVKVDGQVLLADVPVTYLLFLEKQLVNLNTFVSKLPVLDPGVQWHKDENTGAWASDATETTKGKKVPRVLELAKATEKHPAQVEVYHEDVVIGYWTKVDFSGAVHAVRKAELLDRVEKLTTAVKFAREEANNADVFDENAGEKVFGYLFA